MLDGSAGKVLSEEHWSCGGISFPDDAGTMITLTGVHSGTYRVEGIVAMLSETRNSSADIPRGYDLVYQTCQNGISSTISFTALTRIDQPKPSGGSVDGATEMQFKVLAHPVAA